MPNPLTDELSAETKAELAAVFAELATIYPPIRFVHYGQHTGMVPIRQQKPWQVNRRGW